MIICRTNMNRTSRYLFHLPQRITAASVIALMAAAELMGEMGQGPLGMEVHLEQGLPGAGLALRRIPAL